MKIPKKINPCPIIDANLEIRFSSSIHSSAVFGLIYNELKSDFPNVEKLPILQLPEAIRTGDKKLQFKPYYKITNPNVKNLIVQIGPEVLSIGLNPEYVGWDAYFNHILEIIKNVRKLNVIADVNRFGLRYINYFPNDIYNDIKFSLSLNEVAITPKNTTLRTELEFEDLNCTLQITNNALNNNQPGSFIDLDIFKDKDLGDFFNNHEGLISKAHEIEKQVFFPLLKPDFLAKLNPEY